jgi:hypothetical protein
MYQQSRRAIHAQTCPNMANYHGLTGVRKHDALPVVHAAHRPLFDSVAWTVHGVDHSHASPKKSRVVAATFSIARRRAIAQNERALSFALLALRVRAIYLVEAMAPARLSVLSSAT